MTGETKKDQIDKIIKLYLEGVPADRISRTMMLPLNWVIEAIEDYKYAERADKDAEDAKNQ